jgi:hypothetical protein
MFCGGEIVVSPYYLFVLWDKAVTLSCVAVFFGKLPYNILQTYNVYKLGIIIKIYM